MRDAGLKKLPRQVDLHISPRLSCSFCFYFLATKKIDAGQFSSCCEIKYLETLKKTQNMAIEELCGKSMRHSSFSRLVAVTENFSKKTKNLFLDKVYGSMCTKFQVCIVFRSARRRDTNHTYTSEIRNILNRLLASRGF